MCVAGYAGGSASSFSLEFKPLADDRRVAGHFDAIEKIYEILEKPSKFMTTREGLMIRFFAQRLVLVLFRGG